MLLGPACDAIHPYHLGVPPAIVEGQTQPRALRDLPMASLTPHFANDRGVDKIGIGVREFQCMGARPPFDHPHVFLDMGAEGQIICPYCSTLYVYDPRLAPDATDPAGCLVEGETTAAA